MRHSPCERRCQCGRILRSSTYAVNQAAAKFGVRVMPWLPGLPSVRIPVKKGLEEIVHSAKIGFSFSCAVLPNSSDRQQKHPPSSFMFSTQSAPSLFCAMCASLSLRFEPQMPFQFAKHMLHEESRITARYAPSPRWTVDAIRAPVISAFPRKVDGSLACATKLSKRDRRLISSRQCCAHQFSSSCLLER